MLTDYHRFTDFNKVVLGYIAHLLRYPDTEFHVLDLYGGIASQREDTEITHTVSGSPRHDEDLEKAGMHIAGPGDAGEMLDEQAKLAYRRRLVELREELAEAKRLGKVERAEQAEQEIGALSRELSRAVGLGGRDRVAASASERARQSVTKSIKSALDRIAQADVTLGGRLSQCIKTGTNFKPRSRRCGLELSATHTSAGHLSVLHSRTDRICRAGRRAQRDSHYHRPRAERPGFVDNARGRTRGGQEPSGNGDDGVCLARWIPMRRWALLRKR